MSEEKVINLATGEAVVNLCAVCAFEVTDGKCPNEVNHSSHELPPPRCVRVGEGGIDGEGWEVACT